MAQTLRINNYDRTNLVELSNLDADAAVGAVSVTLKTNQNFATGDFAVIGTPGAEGSEIVTIGTVNADLVTTGISATKLPHKRYDQFTKLLGNQVKIYRAANVNGTQPADGSFASIATVTLDPDQMYTDYSDSTGGSDYWYRYTYYNSATTNETNPAQSPAIRAAYGAYISNDEIRHAAGFDNARYVTDSNIDSMRLAAQAEIDSTLGGYYTVPFTSPVNAFIADITKRLAAGLLLVDQYGSFGTLNTQNGTSKVEGARADLERLREGKLTLTDSTGAPITSDTASTNTYGFSGYPTSTIEGDDPDVTGSVFSMDKVY